jgi:hypothetical protein
MRNVILKALAIASALAFLAVVMVNACARYAAPTKAAPVVHPAPAPAAPPPPYDHDEMRAAPTKAAPVFEPRPLVRPPKQSAEPQRQAP